VDGSALVEVFYLDNLDFALAPCNSWTAAVQHLVCDEAMLQSCVVAALDTGYTRHWLQQISNLVYAYVARMEAEDAPQIMQLHAVSAAFKPGQTLNSFENQADALILQ
jgi:hypothetical protein